MVHPLINFIFQLTVTIKNLTFNSACDQLLSNVRSGPTVIFTVRFDTLLNVCVICLKNWNNSGIRSYNSEIKTLKNCNY